MEVIRRTGSTAKTTRYFYHCAKNFKIAHSQNVLRSMFSRFVRLHLYFTSTTEQKTSESHIRRMC